MSNLSHLPRHRCRTCLSVSFTQGFISPALNGGGSRLPRRSGAESGLCGSRRAPPRRENHSFHHCLNIYKFFYPDWSTTFVEKDYLTNALEGRRSRKYARVESREPRTVRRPFDAQSLDALEIMKMRQIERNATPYSRCGVSPSGRFTERRTKEDYRIGSHSILCNTRFGLKSGRRLGPQKLTAKALCLKNANYG